MGALFVILRKPQVQILLQFFQVGVDFFSERHGIKFVLNGAVEPLTDAVGLGRLGLGLGMVDIFDGQVELIFVVFPVTAIFGAAVSQDTEKPDIMVVVPGDYRR